jgi:hypothetical protein
MIADQRYVTGAIRNAIAKLSGQSSDLSRRFGNYNQVLRGIAGAKTQQINFALDMQKIENNMVRAQKVEDIAMAKGLMGQLCNQIVGIISGQYVLDLSAATKFQHRITALQFACYIQKRYQYRADSEKGSLVAQLNNMLNDEAVGPLDNNPQTFARSVAAVIKGLLSAIKADLPDEYKYRDEVIDQIAEISSFDGGTAEIAAHNYSIDLYKLRKMNIMKTRRKADRNLIEQVI